MNERRYRRICQMMAMRQPDLTICLEEVHKPHNVSAIVRSADAVGIHTIHAIWPDQQVKLSVSSAAGSNSWVNVISHPSTEAAISQLKSQNMQVLVTHLSEQAIDFREIDYTQPTCIMVGQEKKGISAKALELADKHIIIPMVGMVQSLNVSVASALILYEAQRQRQLAGMYSRETSLLSEQEQQQWLFEGGYPVLAEVAKRKGLPRPYINAQGQIEAEESWWAQMQLTEKMKKRQLG
ncbi:tRNA (guanosine(18)-2'-O)-methyltransferase TrmH [Providencia stuartii]|uniref:tRNA (guanosine(18)-2'-O)-methyltransferase n=1 Tax=Providencia stuartii (strain MRSN 2154) TaxID=1157951 RepID=A0A140NLZ2_PROSM|nr:MULTISPECIES: tRNA (guanosine(18)-2'-O)-methyltransferase TrmH [Providencia]AFH93668.1 tRNA guanosine-2'-O-methyltransferase [Providencia stuartii MRSN 2154]MDE8747676.1 tRNA (guanosine(18)-2'-O)-methyltransferase TrmH [Providencia thailandensis]MDE8766682.1 tRNA (guanosine(18)-2'-O)-methyltransferase TrmH [Providencia thailandensis]MDE8779347.1 tRNA (guanosine(18)-2'-O)-methyltransferase TrmH [Providencia thailandensis]MDE8783437.1 tRNA (guanosine(18)-2'-O)-methyltransferase TrmH [Providen